MISLLEPTFRLYPLGPDWEYPESFTEELELRGAQLKLRGLAAKNKSGLTITASAAHDSLEPAERCYFELLERASVVAAIGSEQKDWLLLDENGNSTRTIAREELFLESPHPQSWNYSKSNGVALHSIRSQAMRSALFELTERDRILKSWSGLIAPRRIPLPSRAALQLLSADYAFEAYAFDDPQGFASSLSVAGLFGFPLTDKAPFVYGFAADEHAPDALERATGECLQRLGFLWGEELPVGEPDFSPSPDYHQEKFLGTHAERRGSIGDWLAGSHARYAPTLATQSSTSRNPVEIRFVDLTPAHLAGRLHVMKVLCAAATPLTFGKRAPPYNPELPEDLWIHPLA